MAEWVDVASVEEIAPGTWRTVDIDDVEIAVINVDGSFYAIEDMCTHDGGDLSSGHMEGCEIICPRHGARFCIKTGAVTAPPAYEAVTTFPVRVFQGMIQVRDPRWD